MLEVTPDLQWLLGGTIVLYVAGMYALSFRAQRKIQDSEDFLVAGRRLPLSLAWATLLATWFGAGTILTATDEVRSAGLERAALDPLGAGFCLILAGLFFAGPLWEMRLLTVSDFFRRRFGRAAELLSAWILVPSYFGWIAAQLVALAGLLDLFFGLDPKLGILLVAIVGVGYTLLGGMWSVTLTDAVQIGLVLAGLIILGVVVLGNLGGGDLMAGLLRLGRETPPELLRPVPVETARGFLVWVGIFCVGALGNLPGQDLLQRVFAARSATVARRACLLAGLAYLGFGCVPITLGLAARLLIPEDLGAAVLPALAHLFLSPLMIVIFTVTLISAVLSTIDSAILSPASVLSQNVFTRFHHGRLSALGLNRIAVLVVAAASVGIAYLGEDAYSLLEGAYELTLVGLFAPLAMGLYRPPKRQAPAVLSMLTGTGLWLLHGAAGWTSFAEPWTSELGLTLPVSLSVTALGLAVYWLGDRRGPPHPPGATPSGVHASRAAAKASSSRLQR